jgi:hypothetical protein
MTLCSYIIAKTWLSASTRTGSSELPTPMQLSMLVKVVAIPGFSTLLQTFKYQFSSSRKASMPIIFMAPAYVLAGSFFLGWAITAADTWLHITSSTVRFTTSTVVTDQLEASGRGLTEVCLKLMDPDTMSEWDSGTYPCNLLWPSDTDQQAIEEFINTAFGISLQNFVGIVDDYALLLPVPAKTNTDYLASTFGMHSSCRLASNVRGLHFTGQNAAFNCSTTSGWPRSGPFAVDLMSSEQIPAMWTKATDSEGNATKNPFNFGFAQLLSLVS